MFEVCLFFLLERVGLFTYIIEKKSITTADLGGGVEGKGCTLQ